MEQVLTLHSFGARLRAKDGLFKVSIPDLSGAQNEQEFEYAAHTVQTIMLHPRTSVSADALLLAEKNGTMVIVVNEEDNPMMFMAGLHPSGAVEIWRQQVLLQNTARGFEFARDWLCLKEQRKIKFLARLRRYRDGEAVKWIDQCSAQLKESLIRLQNTRYIAGKYAECTARLRGLEGNAQKVYLETLSRLLPARTRFDGRSRPAADLFNAMLNYAYGVLYHKIEQILWQCGLNPYYGFLHGESRKQKSLLFDFIEPYRPWMDQVVFTLCAGKELSPQKHLGPAPAHSNGGLWLNREGKRLLLNAIHERFGMLRQKDPQPVMHTFSTDSSQERFETIEEERDDTRRSLWNGIDRDARMLIHSIAMLPLALSQDITLHLT